MSFIIGLIKSAVLLTIIGWATVKINNHLDKRRRDRFEAQRQAYIEDYYTLAEYLVYSYRQILTDNLSAIGRDNGYGIIDPQAWDEEIDRFFRSTLDMDAGLKAERINLGISAQEYFKGDEYEMKIKELRALDGYMASMVREALYISYFREGGRDGKIIVH